MQVRITASMLYDLVRCPHRVAMDLTADPGQRDPVSPFVELLWEKGHAFERDLIAGLKLPFTDLKGCPECDKERLTLEAIQRGDGLIYGGRTVADDLVGEPDLLRRQGDRYVAGDIKSGAGAEGATDDEAGKPKEHYAVQLALYADILERLGRSGGRRAFVWDIRGDEVSYDLDAPQGARQPTTLWQSYQAALQSARAIASGSERTTPARVGGCKLCHWRTACKMRLVAEDDLTLIPELGRAKRDKMLTRVRTVRELANSDLSAFVRGKRTVFPGIGPETLRKLHGRARLLTTPGARPYLKEAIPLPVRPLELFFDVETDPMQDVCYLHGFVERRNGDRKTEKYVAFFASEPTPEEEEQQFASAWAYVRTSRPCLIYYYSPYERTIWRRLQAKYPRVASGGDIEAVFSPGAAVDLYTDVVRSRTEWPTNDHSVKTLAAFLGFRWRDREPSGTAAVEWYQRWIDTGDPAMRQRILDYNEDDCAAMHVLLDGIRTFGVGPA